MISVKAITIEEKLVESADSLHAMLKRELGFPEYYGANLAALDDCLGDVDHPVRIIVIRESQGCGKDWLDGFCRVLARASNENECVQVRIVHAATGEPVTLAAVMERLDAMQGSIDALVGKAPGTPSPQKASGRDTARNLASGSDGDRFECGACGCRVSDLLEETRLLFDGIEYCPHCGCEISNPGGSDALKWVSELI